MSYQPVVKKSVNIYTIFQNLKLTKLTLKDVVKKHCLLSDLKTYDIRIFCTGDAQWILENITNADFAGFVDACDDLNQRFNKQYPIHSICTYGSKEQIKYIVSKGVDLEVPTKTGWYPIHMICAYHKEELVKYLLDINVNIGVITNDNHTVCMMICEKHNFETITYFFERYYDTSNNMVCTIAGKDGNTPLHYICSFSPLQTIQYFADNYKKLDWNAPNTKGHTPLDFVKSRKLILK